MHPAAAAGGRTIRPMRSAESFALARRRGQDAEERAARYLTSYGLELIARNVRCKAGELDLVCLDGELLVIVEVRQRSSSSYGGAAGSIAERKRQRIIRATRYLLGSSPGLRRRCVRFDVIALQGCLEQSPQITWIKDAFRAT